ncbi:MAG: DUF4384 domain-containing protein [Thermoguttaceae bacterium]|nr:DUF4384 domain-containing protein [Thermoguttaceae bacterium]
MKRYLTIFGLLCLYFGISGTVSDAAASGARGMVVTERRSETFYVNISMDHQDRVYEEGDRMHVTVTSSRSGYLYLLYKDAVGNVSLLFPNKFEQNNKIEANTQILIPSQEMNFDLTTQAPFGKETLQAVVTLQPIKDASVADFRNSGSVKSLSERDVYSLNQGVRGVAVTEKERGSTPQMAEFNLDITTYPRGGRPSAAKKERIFVGIGVARYEHSRINSLPACEGDLQAMGKFFAQNSYINLDKSLIYKNEEVTMENMRKLFTEYLRDNTKPGDEVIIYWTGHGSRYSDTNGDENDGMDETLVLYDSKPNDPETQLRDDEFGRWLQDLSGRKVLVILDTCYSGGLGSQAKSLTSDAEWDFGFGECAYVKDIGQSDLALITSSAQNEVSLMRSQMDMSVMTWFIVKELQNTPSLTHKQLYQNIKGKVYDFVKEAYEVEQNVFLQDDLSVPMILNP